MPIKPPLRLALYGATLAEAGATVVEVMTPAAGNATLAGTGSERSLLHGPASRLAAALPMGRPRHACLPCLCCALDHVTVDGKRCGPMQSLKYNLSRW